MRTGTGIEKRAAAALLCVFAAAFCLIRGTAYSQQPKPAGPDTRYDVGTGMRGSLDYYNPYEASKLDPYDSYKQVLPGALTPVPGPTPFYPKPAPIGLQITPPPYYPKRSQPYYDMRRDNPYYDEYGRIKRGPDQLPEVDRKGVETGRQWYKNMPYRNPRRE